MKHQIPGLLIIVLISTSCSVKKESTSAAQDTTVTRNGINEKVFGKLSDGREVLLYTLRNNKGTEMQVINYGGIIVSLKVADRTGTFSDVVLGYDSLSSYINSNPYFGALIGRYGNRIARGKFTLDGVTYSLATNNGENHLHGGLQGFDKVYWNIEKLNEDSAQSALKLTYSSADGEEGYPGNLVAEVIYTLTDNDEVKFEYTATTDKKTIVNLTQHTYFNLSNNQHDILNHELMIDGDQFLPVDKTLIPTGKLSPVDNTPFDFRTLKAVGERIDQADPQLKLGGGYDHCWVINQNDGSTVQKVAEVYEKESGRIMEVFTTEPGLQFYSGNFLDGSLAGKGGVKYTYRYGLCLETQHYPDSPNKPAFPSVVLKPGDVYKTTTVYKFGVK